MYHWKQTGIALHAEDMKKGTSSGNQAESRFIIKHPISGECIIFLNGGYSISNNPLRFPPIQPYPFKSGRHTLVNIKASGNWGDGTNCLADDDGAGFAHEILKYENHWFISGVVGKDGQFKLKFTPIEWTVDSFHLAG